MTWIWIYFFLVWDLSAVAEATGRKLFSGEGMHNCDLMLITLPEE